MRAGQGLSLAVAALTLTLSACASTTESNTGRTATEQLLLARASDKAVEGLVLPLPLGASVFVDDAYFQGEGTRYAVSAIRSGISDAGFSLARNKDEANAVFEIRAGALSLEQMRRVFGIPETFFIDRDGTVRSRQVGPVTEEGMDRRIAEILG